MKKKPSNKRIQKRYQGYQSEYLGGPGDRDYYHDYSLGTGTAMRRNPDGERLIDRGFYGKGPKGWRRTDESILEEACEALTDSFLVNASNIDVEVKDGIIRLMGRVDSRAMKKDAENCVEDISGVEDVRNELLIGSSRNSEEFLGKGSTQEDLGHLDIY